LELLNPDHGPAEVEVRVKLGGRDFTPSCFIIWDGNPIDTWYTNEEELWCLAPRGIPGQTGNKKKLLFFKGHPKVC
jgi:hypothetical protein